MTVAVTKDAAPAKVVLAQRILAVAAVLLPERVGTTGSVALNAFRHAAEVDETAEEIWAEAAACLDGIVARLVDESDPAVVWLVIAAISTVTPDSDEVLAAQRELALLDRDEAAQWLLGTCMALAVDRGNPRMPVRIVDSGVLVEVDFSARFNLHTGIQRVVRSLVPRWDRDHDIVLVAWTPGGGAMRTLDQDESTRVLKWASGGVRTRQLRAAATDEQPWSLVIPWRSVVVLSEVPDQGVAAKLSALAEYSGNTVAAIGYDCIPIISSDMLPPGEPNKFVKYLSMLKHIDRVAGISESASNEFRGFVDMLPAQGLSGPTVTTCVLPVQTLHESTAIPKPPVERNLVLCVGSFEPRKNQMAVLFAAERLWREGVEFRLQFVGGGGVGTAFPSSVKRLARKGRDVGIAEAVSDSALDELYAHARFSVFASLHEGYGLPVAESFAHGVPVITSDYGSTREIAGDGGALLIDPRDDDELYAAMRELLTSDSTLVRLKQELADRPMRSWDDYAADLWRDLVEGAR
ncbi:Glycosyl transferases group 1 [Frankineae bacterium MT45]|nr:Glycosyl transferases group 1 [Frankineae bacterium MT45]